MNLSRKEKKKNCFPPQFGDLLSNFDLCRKASFVKQAESVPDLHKAFVFCVLLISNLQLNWRVALGEETKLSTYENISRCTLLCWPLSFCSASGPTLLSYHFLLVFFFPCPVSGFTWLLLFILDSFEPSPICLRYSPFKIT